VIWLTRFARSAPILAAALLVSCGSPATPTAHATSTATVSPTFSATATPTPTPAATSAGTAEQLSTVASMVYPACTPAKCTGTAMFTTCDAGSSGSDIFASCPLTSRLVAQLKRDVNGVTSAPDPVGGGQDPAWTTELVTAAPSATGGVAHVTLGFGPGTMMDKYDLVLILQGSLLLVDDIYCTGTDPAGGDVYATGWLNRSACST
jgi:hypothetical protein